jgi:hypothetical protein
MLLGSLSLTTIAFCFFSNGAKLPIKTNCTINMKNKKLGFLPDVFLEYAGKKSPLHRKYFRG